VRETINEFRKENLGHRSNEGWSYFMGDRFEGSGHSRFTRRCCVSFPLGAIACNRSVGAAQQKPYSMASPEGPTDRGQTGRSPFFPNFIKCGTYARADFTSVREKSCPLNSSGSPVVFASA
jgi:hypothetical protein